MRPHTETKIETVAKQLPHLDIHYRLHSSWKPQIPIMEAHFGLQTRGCPPARCFCLGSSAPGTRLAEPNRPQDEEGKRKQSDRLQHTEPRRALRDSWSSFASRGQLRRGGAAASATQCRQEEWLSRRAPSRKNAAPRKGLSHNKPRNGSVSHPTVADHGIKGNGQAVTAHLFLVNEAAVRENVKAVAQQLPHLDI